MGFRDIQLGEGDEGPVTLSRAARNLHMQVVGLSGQGKSYFLEHMIRQDIRNGAGVCLIDPHGELYDSLVKWLAEKEIYRKRRIHLINPAFSRWSVAFNPLAKKRGDVSTRVGAMIEACQVVWGDEESGGHRTLGKLLYVVLATLAAKGLSIREAPLVANIAYTAQRQQLVDEIGDDDLLDQWREIDAVGDRERAQQFAAVQNRLRDMMLTPVVRSMLGQTENVLDFTTCMQRGHIVLVNLAHKGRMKPQVAQMVGALITADMFYCAQVRDIAEAKKQPFYAYIDECAQYLNETIVRSLDETRKYGLHYVLSHQRLAQLGDRPEDPIRNGVVGGAQTKAVFLLEDKASTTEMGEFLFGKEFDFERAKESMIRPVVVGYEREILRGESVSEGESRGAASGAGAGLSSSSGITMADVDDPTSIITTGEGMSESHFNTESSAHSQSRSVSEHEALVPILEERPTALFSLPEQQHEAAMRVRNLEPRVGYIYRADDRKAVKFRTADLIPAKPKPHQIDDLFRTIAAREPSCQPTEQIENQIQNRRLQLVEGDETVDPEDFWREH